VKWWQTRGLRFKIISLIIVSLVFVFGIVFWAIYNYLQTDLWNNQVNAALDLNITTSLQLEELMITNQWNKVPTMLQNLGKKPWRAAVDDIAIYNDQNKMMAFVGGFQTNNPFQRSDVEVTDINDPTCWVCHKLPLDQRPTSIVLTINNQQVLRNSVPLYNKPECEVCHSPENKVLGDSIIDISLSKYQQTSALILAGVSGGGVLTILVITIFLYFLVNRILISPIGDLLNATQTVVQGNYNPEISIKSSDEIGKLSQAFLSMTGQLRNLIGNLEQRVVERTNALEHRSNQLRLAVNIGSQAISYRDKTDLVKQTAFLIAKSYDYPEVNIFLLDDSNENLILVAASSVPGNNLIADHFKISLTGLGFIQGIVSNGEANIITPNSPGSSVHDLADIMPSESCLAIPLKIGKRIIGVLDLHGSQNTIFNNDDLMSMQLLANQISIGIDNANLFAQNQDNLNQLEASMAASTYEHWAKKIGKKSDSFKYTSAGVVEIRSQSSNKILPSDPESTRNENRMDIPITLRGQKIGKITLSRSKDLAWLDSDKLVAMDISNKVALALENARLLEETQLRAAQEQVINNLSSSFSRTFDLDSLLQAAVRQLHQLPDVTDVSVIVNPPKSTTSLSDREEMI
jgi:GAF domain-containing protein/HAMP domain-containing protein